METSALWAFEDDIRNRSFRDWLRAHTSFMKPLHRYEGEMSLLSDRLVFSGTDTRNSEEVRFVLPKHSITQLYHGFDDIFGVTETRSLGLGGRPLRISFSHEGEDAKLYLITNYNLGVWNNEPCFQALKSWTGAN